MAGGISRPACALARYLGDKPWTADFQLAANLSLGWRPDSAIAAVVRAWTCSQPVGRHDYWPTRRSGVHSSRYQNSIHLDWSYLGFRLDELLERISAREGAGAIFEVAETPGVRLSGVHEVAAIGRILEVWEMRAAIRYLSE